jgi:CheY-like chemotaxis protein
VLVVEDNALNQKIVATMMKSIDPTMQMESAMNGMVCDE